MADLEKVIKGLKCRMMADKRCANPCEESGLCHYAKAIHGLDGEIYRPYVCDKRRLIEDTLELLKEKQGISVDAFLQWCIESHRMGDASRKGIEYWINEFKAWKQKAKDGDQEC